MMSRIALLVLIACASTYAQTPAFELPAPTGPFPIGTSRFVLTDRSRDEVFAPGRRHDIEVIAWYPSAGDTRIQIDGATFASLLAGIDFTAARRGWYRREVDRKGIDTDLRT